jgi:hypothetical protein
VSVTPTPFTGAQALSAAPRATVPLQVTFHIGNPKSDFQATKRLVWGKISVWIEHFSPMTA